jgi:5'-nucleotidase
MPRLIILHTNDIHGRVAPLSRIASRVREIRRECERAGEYCLYVDAGDAEDTTMLESSLTKGSAMEGILRGAGCEHVALGNAIPVRYGHQAIADLAKHFGRPLLCANLLNENGDRIDGLQPMAFETYAGLKVAIIGLTAPWAVYSTFFKLQVSQPEELLPGLIEEARSQGAKTIIVLSHLGSDPDQELAGRVQGIDVIIGAHDHKELNPPVIVNGTIIVQAGDFGRLLGRLDLTLDPHTGKVLEHQGQLIPITEDIPLDPSTQDALQEMMEREIGYLNDSFELAGDRECAAGNLLADALLERMQGAQISIALAGHWQSGLNAGRLSQGALFAAHRSTANPAKLVLTGSQIVRFLREALKPENAARTLHSLRGGFVGTPHVAGAVVHCSENMADIEVELNGKPLEPDQKYIVASTDMEFSDWIGYLIIPEQDVEFEVPTITPEVLQDHILRHSPLHSPQSRFITQFQK